MTATVQITETNTASGSSRTLAFTGETPWDAATRAVDYIEDRPLAQTHAFLALDGGWGSLAGDVDQAAGAVRQAIEWREQERRAALR